VLFAYNSVVFVIVLLVFGFVGRCLVSVFVLLFSLLIVFGIGDYCWFVALAVDLCAFVFGLFWCAC